MNKPLEGSESLGVGSGRVPVLATLTGKVNDRGVALVITLLLLFLLSIIGLAAVMTSSSDMLINGYYSNYRGSFYAAESGLNIARQTIQNNLNPGAITWNAAWSCGVGTSNGPLSATLGSTVASQIASTYGTTNLLTGSNATNPGAAQNSWAGSFKITTPAASMISLAPNYPVPTCPSGTPTGYQYIYNYNLTSVGSASGAEQSTISESGALIINVSITQPSQNLSFAYYGAFITNYGLCSGALVPGTMTGPMFTDGAWNYEGGGSYIFTDAVGQVNADAGYYDRNGNCHQVAGPSWSGGGQTVAPQFQNGFNLNQPSVAQPNNSYSQAWATIDGRGMNETNSNGVVNGAPTNADLNANLKSVSGTAYPVNGASSGVYFNSQTVNGVPTIQGGGFYVQGNANIVLTPSGSSAQVYTITQGSPAVTTTITVDPVANTTVVTSGTNVASMAGVPTNLSTSPSSPGTMLYVNGAITGLTGPGEGQGAIQNGTALTVVASGDVDVTGDVRYVTEPVTTAANQIPGDPVDTLIPGHDNNQDLGIFTASGNIVFSSPYADSNLEVDGSQAALGGSCPSYSCGFLVNGCINTLNNVGGQLQTNIFGACLNVENTYYDRRYNTRANFAPPWFPGLTLNQNGNPTVSATVLSPQRTSWLSTSGQ